MGKARTVVVQYVVHSPYVVLCKTWNATAAHVQHQVELKTFLRRLCSRLRPMGSGPVRPSPTSWCQPGRSEPQACLLGKLVSLLLVFFFEGMLCGTLY